MVIKLINRWNQSDDKLDRKFDARTKEINELYNQVSEIKALISHPMHTGLRKDKKTGKKIPRRIINKFTANFNGQEVLYEAEKLVAASIAFIFAYLTKSVSATLVAGLITIWIM